LKIDINGVSLNSLQAEKMIEVLTAIVNAPEDVYGALFHCEHYVGFVNLSNMVQGKLDAYRKNKNGSNTHGIDCE
jgi:hypothetical protein